MEIISALFVENFEMRQAEGGSARLDLNGVYFSIAAPSPFPIKLTPHLLVLIKCPADHSGLAALEVTFHCADEQVARNVQPITVEPGKFGYNLVQAELDLKEPSKIEAHCRIDKGPVAFVPLTVTEPFAG